MCLCVCVGVCLPRYEMRENACWKGGAGVWRCVSNFYLPKTAPSIGRACHLFCFCFPLASVCVYVCVCVYMFVCSVSIALRAALQNKIQTTNNGAPPFRYQISSRLASYSLSQICVLLLPHPLSVGGKGSLGREGGGGMVGCIPTVSVTLLQQ